MFKSTYTLLTQAVNKVAHSIQDRGPSVADVLAEYLASSKFCSLSPSSQEPYRAVLERWVRMEDISSRLIKSLGKRELEGMLAKHSKGAANFLFKRVRVLLRFAIARQYRDDDPTIGIVCKPIGREHATWTDDEIAQFREHYPLGRRERLAFELALNSSQRRGDLARMKWADIRNGRIAVTQQKTGTVLSIPIHPDLQAAFDRVKGARTGNILVRAARPVGKPLTPESLGTLFAEWIDAAGLGRHCVLHGLRKAAARRLAEAGATEKEIAAIGGWKTLGEVARYTRGASQARLADAAMARIVGDGLN